MTSSQSVHYSEVCLRGTHKNIAKDIYLPSDSTWSAALGLLQRKFNEPCTFSYRHAGKPEKVDTAEAFNKCLAWAQAESHRNAASSASVRGRFHGHAIRFRLQRTIFPTPIAYTVPQSMEQIEVDIIPVTEQEHATLFASAIGMNASSPTHSNRRSRRVVMEICLRCKDGWTGKDVRVPASSTWAAVRSKLKHDFDRPVTFSYSKSSHNTTTTATVSCAEDWNEFVAVVDNDCASRNSPVGTVTVSVVPYVTTLARHLPHLTAMQALGQLDVTRGGSAALDIAVSNDDGPRIVELRNEGTRLDETNWMGRSALHRAMETDKPAAAKRLAELGADALLRDRTGATPLHVASSNHAVRALLSGAGSKESTLLRSKDGLGRIAVHRVDDVGALRELMLKNQTVSERDSSNATPLHHAVLHSDDATESLVTEARAPIDAVDCFKKTPLHYAASGGRVKAASLLLANGAKADAADVFGMMPIHYAAQAGEAEIVRMLVSAVRGTDAVNAKDKAGRTPSSLAHDAATSIAITGLSGADLDHVQRHTCTNCGSTRTVVNVKPWGKTDVACEQCDHKFQV